MTIRAARPDDLQTIEEIVREAYSIYIERIGKPPGPMLDDYGALVAATAISVIEEPHGVIAALIVLLQKPGHLLVDNIAVRPERQSQGLGRRLIALAETEARRRGLSEVRLYTHEMMIENIALYTRLGFIETGRAFDAGYDRVFMSKRLDPSAGGAVSQV